MRCSKCQRFLTREQTPHTPPLHKDEILFIKFQVQGFGCTTEIDYLCSRLFEVFFFAFLHVAVVRVYVSRLVLLSLCSRITI